jgi:BirA family biotin operon repressor/biotin-[acetyl-CoA-carboxylase] ligase
LIRIEKIMAQLETECIGREIHNFEELSSTNTTAKEEAEKGAKEGTTIIAETQTSGKGRLDRLWVSPRGGVWLSIILRPCISPEDALKITLTTAVAVARAIRRLFNVKAEIKWPNDVLIDRRKVCGILTEAKLTENTVDFVVVGIGINADFSLQALPKDLQATATTLRETLRKRIDKEKLIAVLLKEFEDSYKLFTTRKFEQLLAEWRSLAGFLGKEVEITSLKEKMQGVAVDITENGALIVELKDGERRTVLSGDMTVQEV